MSYRILSLALIELSEAAESYESRVSGLGADFLAEEAIARILDFPETGDVSQRSTDTVI